MIVKIADIVMEIKSRYKYTYDLCKEYLYEGDEEVKFVIFATDEDIEEERRKTPEFHDALLESTGIYKNICTKIIEYNGMILHSAAISVDDRAYLFSAKSGTGKTTHMNLWLKKFGDRAFVINGDKPIVRMIDDKMYVFGTPWSGKEGINTNSKVLLDAYYILKRGEINKVRNADTTELFAMIYSQTYHPKDSNLRNLVISNIGKFMDNVNGYVLECNMDMEACEVAYGIVKK